MDMIQTESVSYPKNRWYILAILNLGLIIVMLNNLTLNVALPELSTDLNADNSELQWIMDSYVLVFGGTLLLMGALGDRFGRKGTLHTGLVIIGIFSAWTAFFAETSNQVIFARAGMGLGAALVMPSTLSVVLVVFPEDERGKAIGIWAAMAGIGGPIGILVGGWAVENYDWQMVFLINVPFIIVALISGFFIIPKSKDETGRPLDIIGAILSVISLGFLLYAIIEGPNFGWASSEVLLSLLIAIISGSVFLYWENRIEHPLLPLEFFRGKRFTIGLIAISFTMFVMLSFIFMQMLHFQLVREMSPFTAALKALPLPVALLPAATNSDKLVEKFGRSNVISTGILLIASGLLLFSLIEIDTNYWYIATTFVLIGGGMGLTMAPSTTAVMDSVPESKAGVGSATNDASREVGGALGIAVGGSVLNQIYQSSIKIPDSALGQSDTIESSFPSAMNVGKQMIADGNMEGTELIASAKEAFLDGMIAACLVAACVAIIAAIIVKWKLPNDDLLSDEN